MKPLIAFLSKTACSSSERSDLIGCEEAIDGQLVSVKTLLLIKETD